MDKMWMSSVNPNGGTWSIRSVAGDVIADDIPHGEIAEYIVDLHNEYITRED